MINSDEDSNYLDSKKPHMKVLVIGKTGAGKSTAINMFLNQSVNIQYEGDRVIGISQTINFQGKESIMLECNVEQFKDRQSDVGQSSSMSQTRDCNMYTVENDNYIITFVDSPGLGDTEGTSEDSKHIKTIIARVQQLTQINAILYIHRATDCRKDLFLQYYINSLKSMLTKKCQQNVIVCFTSVVNPTKIDAFEVLQQMNIPLDNFFYFENDCLLPPDLFPTTSLDQKTVKSYKKIAKQFWESNQEQFEEMVQTVIKMQPQEAKDLLDLLVKKESMFKIACEKQLQIRNSEQNKEHLQQYKNSIDKVQSDIKSVGPQMDRMPKTYYQQIPYTFTTTITKNVSEKITFCYSCQKKCHNPCGLSEVYSRGSYQLQQCASFGGQNQCKNCSHSIDCHGHTNIITEDVTETRYRSEPYIVMEDVKNEDKAKRIKELKKEKKIFESQVTQLKKDIQKIDDEIKSEFQLIAILHHRISEISMSSTDEFTIKYLDNQIELLDKDPKITIDQKERLLNNYKIAKQNYVNIKKQIDFAKTQNSNIPLLTRQQQQVLNEKLKKTEEDIMNSVKTSISKVQQQQKPYQETKVNNSKSKNTKRFYFF